MTALSTGETYTYDANGNMTCRVEGGITYKQEYNYENLLTAVKKMNGTCTGGTLLETTSFLYDGDGNLVKKTLPDGNKTLYIGGLYEVDKTPGGAVKRTVTYYPAAGAMRINTVGGSNSVYYIVKDHLGSASVITDSTGTVVSGSEQRYHPYGEPRLTATMLTDKLFTRWVECATGAIETGQRDVGLGIYHYGARFYSPKLGRFLSADTIVPGAGNPQAYNRYSYVLGNPLKYIDPTGHYCVGDDEDCADEAGYGPAPSGSGGNNGGGGGGGGGGSPHDDDDFDPNPNGFVEDVFHPLRLDSDYYSLSIYHGSLGWLLAAGIIAAGWAEPSPAEEIGAVTLAFLVNGGVTITVDRYGRMYVSPGVSIGINSVEPLPTISIVQGNLVHGKDRGLPVFQQSSPDEIAGLLTEFSTTHSVCNAFFPCVGTTQSPAAPYDSIEFGAGFPGHINFATFSFGFGPFPVFGNP